MSHWAAPLIGLPWAPGANGPREYYCWGLVRHLCRMRHGIELPELADNAATIAQSSGWRPAPGKTQADDVLLMRGPTGRHVGYLIETVRGLRVLHAAGTMTPRGPVGCVMSQTLAEATADGYHDFEIWRRA